MSASATTPAPASVQTGPIGPLRGPVCAGDADGRARELEEAYAAAEADPAFQAELMTCCTTTADGRRRCISRSG